MHRTPAAYRNYINGCRSEGAAMGKAEKEAQV